MFKLINYLDKGNNKINYILNGNKSKVLSNIYEQLKVYFENKISKSEQNKNDEDMFDKIHNMINSREEQEEQIKINEKELNNNKDNRIQNYNLYNLNSNSTFKLSKTMKINLRKSKILFTESQDIVNEFDDDKDIPWIREEDC